MGYASWSVVFGEQPSAAKWNILGTNDASFNDGTGIADDAIKSRVIDWAAIGGGDSGGIWWEELQRTTLGSAGDTITVSSIPARKYLKIIIHCISSGAINALLRFNNDSGTNYANRVSVNGAADATSVSDNQINVVSTAASADIYSEIELINFATKTKLGRTTQVDFGASAAASNSPLRRDLVLKWANTSDQITRVDIVNGGGGDFATSSEVVVLGHN